MKLFRFRGIALDLHPTFYLLPLVVGAQGWADNPDDPGRGLAQSLGAVALVYTCVVLHEFGHALTARWLGVPVQHIVLLPFGGMALLGRLPRNSWAELLIVAAGPAVNFAIVGICLLLLGRWPVVGEEDLLPTFQLYDILVFLLLSNLVLGCFNLLPAFPMDGGRILRALLAFKLDYLRATRWALNIGRGVAGLGIVFALWTHSFLLAGLFVFILWIGKREYEFLVMEEATRFFRDGQ